MSTAFNRLHKKIALKSYPAERAAQLLERGYVDGDATRAEGFNKIIPEAIRVDPSLFLIEFIGLTTSPDIKPTSWQDLVKYRIAIKRGYKVIESNTDDVPQRRIVDSDRSCIALLKANQIDICIGLKKELAYNAEVQEDSRYNIVKFAELKAYLWLGPRHGDMAPQIARVLNQMKNSGELDLIFRDKLQ